MLPHYWKGRNIESTSDFSFHGKRVTHSLVISNASFVLFTHLLFCEQLWPHTVLRSSTVFRNTCSKQCLVSKGQLRSWFPHPTEEETLPVCQA